MIKSQKFGCEVEFNGITRQAVAHHIASKMNWSTPVYMNDYMQTWTIKDTENRTWKVTYDGSISGPSDSRCELVTPPLNYIDIETLQQVVRIIKSVGGRVDESCGVHVHVDKANHTEKSLKNLVNIIYSKEEMIYKALACTNSRRNRWCKNVDQTMVEKMNKTKNLDMSKLADLWYADDSRRTQHYNSTRYHGLNLHNVWFAQTVEFRYFGATLHAGKIKSYIQFCLAVSSLAIKSKSSKAKISTSQDQKHTFSNWLVKLELVGPEFATCRRFMLENLTDSESRTSYVSNYRRNA